MKTQIMDKNTFKSINENIDSIRKYLYQFIPMNKRHISMLIHIKGNDIENGGVIIINLRSNPRVEEVPWIVINGTGSNTCAFIHSKSPFKTKGRVYSNDIENIRTSTENLNFIDILKNINRDKLLNELL